MLTNSENRSLRGLSVALSALILLTGCEGGVDMGTFNLRSAAPKTQTAPRPKPDARGVISYPNYQMIAARQGDTVADVAARVSLSGESLARYNGLSPDYKLRSGELLALPSRVESTGAIDISVIATNALNTADVKPTKAPAPTGQTGSEPIRHRVERGETAYSIARLYDVSVTSLAKWNGLGPNLEVRVGQQLLIPLVNAAPPKRHGVSKPGAVSVVSTPPSASKPLPKNVKTTALPPSPKLGQFKSPGGPLKFMTPVEGKIIKGYSGKTGGNEGIDIAASVGTAVKSAGDGKVALISKSVGANTIILLRHADNIYTVYANVQDVTLTKGQTVKRGQRIGTVSEGTPPHLHFEIRRGTQSVDPAPFL